MTIEYGPNNGLMDRGAKGEEHYNPVMRFYRAMDLLLQGRVKGRVSSLPGSPANGDSYILLAAGPNLNALARYSAALAAWEYFPAQNGWSMAVLDELDENGQYKEYFFKASSNAWIEKLASGGLTVEQGDARYAEKIKNKLDATVDPGPTNDSSEDYEPLSRWVNVTSGEIFLCVSAAVGAAVWQKATLTIDELGSAALANVGNTGSNLPTAAQVQAMIAAYQAFGPASAGSPGTKGFVPAPPATEVRRYLASDGTWQTITIDDVPPPQGTNLGSGAGVFLDVVGSTLRFKSLRSTDGSVLITEEEGTVNLRVSGGGSGGPISSVSNTGSGSRPVVYNTDTGALTIRGIRGEGDVSVAVSGGDLVISAEGGGGGGGGVTVPTSAEPYYYVYDRTEGTHAVMSQEDLDNLGVVASVTFNEGDDQYLVKLTVDPGTVSLFRVDGFGLALGGLRYRTPVFASYGSQDDYMPLPNDPTIVFGKETLGSTMWVNDEGGRHNTWNSFEAGVLANPTENLITFTRQDVLIGPFDDGLLDFSVYVYYNLGHYGSAALVEDVLPAIDPLASLGPRGSPIVQSYPLKYSVDGVTPVLMDMGKAYLREEAPIAHRYFQNAENFPGSIWLGNAAYFSQSSDLRVRKIIRFQYMSSPFDGAHEVTMFLGSVNNGPYDTPMPAYGRVVSDEPYGNRMPAIAGGDLEYIEDGVGAGFRCAVVHHSAIVGGVKQSIAYLSTDGGDSFNPLMLDGYPYADVESIVGYAHGSISSSPSEDTAIVYKKTDGSYEIGKFVYNLSNPPQLAEIEVAASPTSPFVELVDVFTEQFGNRIYVCDGVSVHWTNDFGVTWNDYGRVVTEDEETDGLRCVKVFSFDNGIMVALLSDGSIKESSTVTGGLREWGDAETVLLNGHKVDVQQIFWEGTLNKVVLGTCQASAFYRNALPSQKVAVAAEYGQPSEETDNQGRWRLAETAPFCPPSKEVQITYGAVNFLSSDKDNSGTYRQTSYDLMCLFWQEGEYDNPQYKDWRRPIGLDLWFFVPQYPVPPGWFCYTRAV